jgi:tRNA G18 (ribose-2'-O)-methylase SpoU
MKPAILLGHLSNKNNEGMIIRTAEAMGINLVMNLSKNKKFESSTKHDRHMHFVFQESTDKFIKFCKENNHSIVCLENTENAVFLPEANYPKNPVFVTGNEKEGVPKEILEQADLVVKIPQAYSYCVCMNTAIACSIVLYDWFQKNIQKRSYGYKSGFSHTLASPTFPTQKDLIGIKRNFGFCSKVGRNS